MRGMRVLTAAAVCATTITTGVWAQAGDPFKVKPKDPARAPAASPDGAKPDEKATPPARPTEPGAEQGLVDLRPKFKKGQELRYVLEVDGKNKIVSKGNADLNQDQTNTQRIVLVMRVKEAGDEGATIEVEYESMRVVMDTPDGKAEFDSTKVKKNPNQTKPGQGKPGQTNPGTPPAGSGNAMDDMLAQIIGPMVGTKLEVKTDRNGAITSVSGGEMLGGGAIEGLLGGSAGSGGGMVPSGKSTSNWLVGGIPGSNGLVKVGQTWTNTDNLGSTPMGGFKMVTTHTLKSASGKNATVMFNGRAEGSDSDGNGALGGLVKFKGGGYRGQYQWDTGAGCLREMNSEMTTEMGGKIGEDEVTMTSSTTTRVKKQ